MNLRVHCILSLIVVLSLVSAHKVQAACRKTSVDTQTYILEAKENGGYQGHEIVCRCDAGDEIITGGCYATQVQNAKNIRLTTNITNLRNEQWIWVCEAKCDLGQGSSAIFEIAVRLVCRHPS